MPGAGTFLSLAGAMPRRAYTQLRTDCGSTGPLVGVEFISTRIRACMHTRVEMTPTWWVPDPYDAGEFCRLYDAHSLR